MEFKMANLGLALVNLRLKLLKFPLLFVKNMLHYNKIFIKEICFSNFQIKLI